MIPQITTDSASIPTDDSLVQQLLHWGFLGSVLLTVNGSCNPDSLPQLYKTVKKVSGFCDLLIQYEDVSEEAGIEMLNIGASKLVVGSASQLEAWPTAFRDRIQLLTDIENLKSATELESQPEIITQFLAQKLRSDRPDGLWPTVICDPLGVALGLAYSNQQSLAHAVATRKGTYWSRSRDELWIKGASSGATQTLLGIRFDCDSDCLRFTVTQGPPGFCHTGTYTCFGDERSIATVLQRLSQRIESSNEKSFTRRLATDAKLLEKKLLEEAKELSDASQLDDRYEVAWETADVFYFSLVAMLKNGVALEEVYAELARRMNRVVRRD